MTSTQTSSSTSRIQAIVFTTLEGYVIYETYYDQLNDVQKCEIRTSFDTISSNHQLSHGTEVVGRFKNGRIAGLVCGKVIGYALGTGYCDELMLMEFLERVFHALVEILDVEDVKGGGGRGSGLDGGVLIESYVVLAHVVDGACVDGVVEEVGVESLRKGLELRAEKYSSGKGRGLGGLVKSMKSMKSSLGR